ncbi:hypothetical protein LTR78_000026 [Recurvomyces mirabilis]|uniref:Uncharacterized protein n=1 Tax=Recurvomyces mirabilis TaxID=574656 RepID=A0AAE0WXD6_9PEZI|nr:hypothetical protein LTR78_000026 [Recurvomyces mirabilis]KAK5161683.1 hypothetical protein LTS14_000027 [Recurvomyces mirabilis]
MDNDNNHTNNPPQDGDDFAAWQWTQSQPIQTNAPYYSNSMNSMLPASILPATAFHAGAGAQCGSRPA